jgi:hypothetical protein
MVAVIIGCEIGFWVLLAAGLAARYVLRAKTLSAALLLAVPAIDVLLLAVSAIDLIRGGAANPHTASRPPTSGCPSRSAVR